MPRLRVGHRRRLRRRRLEPDALDAIATPCRPVVARLRLGGGRPRACPPFPRRFTRRRDAESAALAKRLPLRDAFCAASGRELRLLCLHGRGSNNDITALQFNNMRLRTRLSLDFLHGPEQASAQSSTFELFSAKPFQAWWSGTLSAA